jgi:hypothetical protein
MKKLWAVVIAFAVIVGIYFLENRHSVPINPEPRGTISENNSQVPAGPDNFGTVPANPAAGTGANTTGDLAARAASPGVETDARPNLPPLTILDNARVAIHNYAAAFGENPVGNNAEITAALTGKNPKQINFVTAASGLQVNANGEMVDGFGTPFFFHQLSGHEMEIRSAGEDRKMWTFDDQVTR